MLISRRHIELLGGNLDPDVVKGGLERALKRLGPEETARRLKAPRDVVQAWADGHATMPQRKQNLLLDLLDEISG